MTQSADNPPTVIPITFSRYRFHFRAKGDIQLPPYAGSAWRGVFGHALKHVVCVVKNTFCEECLLYHNCPYSYIFETPPPQQTEMMRLYNSAPHPFILEPLHEGQQHYQANDVLSLGFTLVGKGNRYLSYVIFALQRAGERGLGRGRGQFVLTEVEQENTLGQEDWQTIFREGVPLDPQAPKHLTIPECPAEHIKVTFQTPFNAKYQRQKVDAYNFHFSSFFSPLLRRISLLSYFHEAQQLEADYRTLTEEAEHVQIMNTELYWQNWTRYSSRQKKKINLGGVKGSFEIKGDQLKNFWPFLYYGQYLHAGKGTSMGLGWYTLSY